MMDAVGQEFRILRFCLVCCDGQHNSLHILKNPKVKEYDNVLTVHITYSKTHL